MEGTPPPTVRIYTKRWCGYCYAATRLFAGLGVDFDETPVDRNPELRKEISEKAGNWPTVPMIFVGEHFVGGFTEASALHRAGKLEPLVKPATPATTG